MTMFWLYNNTVFLTVPEMPIKIEMLSVSKRIILVVKLREYNIMKHKKYYSGRLKNTIVS